MELALLRQCVDCRSVVCAVGGPGPATGATAKGWHLGTADETQSKSPLHVLTFLVHASDKAISVTQTTAAAAAPCPVQPLPARQQPWQTGATTGHSGSHRVPWKDKWKRVSSEDGKMYTNLWKDYTTYLLQSVPEI